MPLNIEIDPVLGDDVKSVTGETIGASQANSTDYTCEADGDNANGDAWIVPGTAVVYFEPGDSKKYLLNDQGDGTLKAPADGETGHEADQDEATGTIDYLTGAITTKWEGAPGQKVQTVAITGSPTSGNFKLAYPTGATKETATIATNATAATVQTRLNALSDITVTVAADQNGGPYTVTFTIPASDVKLLTSSNTFPDDDNAEVTVTAAAVMKADYQYFDEQKQYGPGTVPTTLRFRNDSVAANIVVAESDDGVNYELVGGRSVDPWNIATLSRVSLKQIKVASTSSGRLVGSQLGAI